MIVAPGWIWLHIPKTGGTATERMLRALLDGRPGMAFDDTSDRTRVVWHQSLAARREADPGFDPAGRRVVANLRRLPHWVLSYVHFEVQRRGERMAPPRQRLVAGCVPAPDGRLVSADSVLRRFAPEVTHWIRSERMAGDAAAALGLPAAEVARALTAGERGAHRLRPRPGVLVRAGRASAALRAQPPLGRDRGERLR